jgi:hypothetical protein
MTAILQTGSSFNDTLPFNLSAGSDRVLVVFDSYELNASETLSAVSIDGVPGHIIGADNANTMNVYAYYWLESEFTAGFVSGATITRTGLSKPSSWIVTAVLLEDAPQASPTDFYFNSANATGTLAYVQNEVEGGLGILFASNSKTTGTWTFNGGYVQEGTDINDGTNMQVVLAVKSPTADATDVSINIENSLTGDKLGLVSLMYSPASALVLSNVPTEVRNNTQDSITVSNAALGLTEIDFDVRLTNVAGPQASIDNVVDNGSGVYDITFTFPIATDAKFDSDVGYNLYVAADVDNVTTVTLPYLPPVNWDYVVVGAPDVSTDIYQQYAGSAFVTGDQAVWDTLSDPDSAVVIVNDELHWDVNPAPTSNQTVGFYRISSAGTYDTDDSILFDAGAGGSVVPADSRTSVYHIANHLRSLGTYDSQQCNELVAEWLLSGGVSRTQLNVMLYEYLGGLGYTGTFNDRIRKWREDS